MGHLAFKDPWWFLALALLPLISWWRSRRRVPVFLVPFAAAWHRPSRVAPARWPVALAFTGLVLLVGALARPQRLEDKREVSSEGYDIMLVVDVSGSMLREDAPRPGLVPNRIQTIKPIVQSFIERRPQDRIGLVLFGRRAYTLSPLTFDHDWIARQLSRIKIGMIDPDGTVIGDGLGTALNRLAQENRIETGHRLGAFIVLLTDGGESQDRATRQPLSSVPPLSAADLARAKHIPIYTIGVGKDGYVWEPMDLNSTKMVPGFSNDIDPALLHDIAERTGGRYFRAEDKNTIEQAFEAIDRAQKIEFQAKSYLLTTELFGWLAGPALVLLALASLLARPPGRARPLAPEAQALSPQLGPAR